MQTWADQVAKWRRDSGLTLRAASIELGVDESTLYRWEKGLTLPKELEVRQRLQRDYGLVVPDAASSASLVERVAVLEHQMRTVTDLLGGLAGAAAADPPSGPTLAQAIARARVVAGRRESDRGGEPREPRRGSQ